MARRIHFGPARVPARESPETAIEALLERGFASLARGDQRQANQDFLTVLRLVPPGSAAARRAQAGLRGEPPAAAGQDAPGSPRAAPGGKR